LNGRGKSNANDDQEENLSVAADHVSLPPTGDLHAFEECLELPDKVTLDDCSIPDGLEDKDVYRWAILYENQRGYVVY
jgi:hypothetical protein